MFDEAARKRTHVRIDGERESDRMPRRRVGVLADDEHLDVVERTLERAQHPVPGGKVVPARRDLGAEAIAECGDVGTHRLERARPAGIDQSRAREFGQRHRHRWTLSRRSGAGAARGRAGAAPTAPPDAS